MKYVSQKCPSSFAKSFKAGQLDPNQTPKLQGNSTNTPFHVKKANLCTTAKKRAQIDEEANHVFQKCKYKKKKKKTKAEKLQRISAVSFKKKNKKKNKDYKWEEDKKDALS